MPTAHFLKEFPEVGQQIPCVGDDENNLPYESYPDAVPLDSRGKLEPGLRQ